MSRTSLNPFGKFRLHGEVIVDERACGKCGYSLKGLKSGGRCPECGTPISTKGLEAGFMTEAPVPYLARLALWANVAAASGVSMFLLSLGVAPFLRFGYPMVGLTFLLAVLGWVWGYAVHQVTRPREFGRQTKIDPEKEWSRLRLVVRWTQWGWGGTFTLLFAAATSAAAWQAIATATAATAPPPPMPTIAGLCAILAALCLLPAFFGLMALAVYLSFLADWANDLSLGMRLRLSPFMLLVSVPVTGLSAFLLALWRPSPRLVFLAPVYVFVGGIFLFCVGCVTLPIIQFANLCRWATKNQNAALDRDRRTSATIARRIEDAQIKDSGPSLGAHKPARPQGNYVPPSASAGGAYDLAPEDPPRPV